MKIIDFPFRQHDLVRVVDGVCPLLASTKNPVTDMDKCVKCGGAVMWQACDRWHLFCDPCWHEYVSLYGEFDTNGDVPCPICVKNGFGGGVLVTEVDLQIHFSFMELIRQRDGISPMEDRKHPYPLRPFKGNGTERSRLLSKGD